MKKNKLKGIDWLYFLSLLVLFSSFFSSLFFLKNFVNIDLFNRQIATKTAHLKLDPYHYKWQKGDSKEIFNPFDNNDKKINSVFDSPAILAYPIINIKFGWIRVMWFVVQWLLLIFSIILLAKSTSDMQLRKLILTLNFLIFPASYFWKVHILKGQIYILAIFIIALSIYIKSRRWRFSSLLSGFIWGLGSVFFPIMLLFFPFILLSKRFKQASGFILGVILNIAISIHALGNNIWINYFNMMRLHLVKNLPFSASNSLTYNIVDNLDRLLFKGDLEIFDYSLSSIIYKLFNYQMGYKIPVILSLIIFFILLIKFLIKGKGSHSELRMYIFALIFIFLFQLIIYPPFFLYNNLIFIPIIALSVIQLRQGSIR